MPGAQRRWGSLQLLDARGRQPGAAHTRTRLTTRVRTCSDGLLPRFGQPQGASALIASGHSPGGGRPSGVGRVAVGPGR